jgi:hypothetical protein
MIKNIQTHSVSLAAIGLGGDSPTSMIKNIQTHSVSLVAIGLIELSARGASAR